MDNILDKHYNTSLASQINSKLAKKCVTKITELCGKGNVPMLDDASIKKLSLMEEDRQIKWIVNPLVQFFIEREICALQNNANNSCTNTSNTSKKLESKDNKKPEVKKPEPNLEEPEPDEPEPDEPAGGFNLFD